jgi:hypothetical protein
MFYNIKAIILLLSSLLILSQAIEAQEHKGANAIIKDQKIHSLNIYARNDINSLAIIELASEQKVHINFDYFQEDGQELVYKIEHCNADWKRSSLSEFKFLEGFSDNYIRDYEFSFNSNINYTNYSLEIPNDDIKLSKSGNYNLLVFKDDNKKDTLFIARFYILEPLLKIKGRVRSCTNPRFLKTSQELDFTVENSSLKIYDPINDLRTYIWQNGDQSNRKELKALFIRDKVYSFDYNEENVFMGGNEFRQFNTSNTKYVGRFIDSVKEDADYSYYNLSPAYNRHFKKYIYERDINGNYIISSDNSNNPNIEAEYSYVNFTLAMDTPLQEDIYVYGKLSNWGLREKFKMKYNLKIRAYTLSLLLKQGYYNYEYIVAGRGKIDRTFIEGSHYQTENDYYIAVYFRDYSSSYDRLLGFKHLNSSIHQAGEINN